MTHDSHLARTMLLGAIAVVCSLAVSATWMAANSFAAIRAEVFSIDDTVFHQGRAEIQTSLRLKLSSDGSASSIYVSVAPHAGDPYTVAGSPIGPLVSADPGLGAVIEGQGSIDTASSQGVWVTDAFCVDESARKPLDAHRPLVAREAIVLKIDMPADAQATLIVPMRAAAWYTPLPDETVAPQVWTSPEALPISVGGKGSGQTRPASASRIPLAIPLSFINGWPRFRITSRVGGKKPYEALRLRRGSTRTLISGRISPAVAGKKISVFARGVERGSATRRIGTTRTDRRGRFALRTSALSRRRGMAHVHVQVAGDRGRKLAKNTTCQVPVFTK